MQPVEGRVLTDEDLSNTELRRLSVDRLVLRHSDSKHDTSRCPSAML